MNVLLIKGSSQYDAMRYYIDEVEEGFRLAGYNTIILDLLEATFDFQLAELIATEKIDYIFTFNALITDNISKMNRAIYITYLCDHPAYHHVRLQVMDEKAVIFTVDRFHEEYIRTYYPNIKHVKFIPLSGGYSRKYIPYAERTRDVVFTGTYSRPEQVIEEMSEVINVSKLYEALYTQLLESVRRNSSLTLEENLQEVLNAMNMQVSKEQFRELCHYMQYADKYARVYYRDKVIRCIVENGIKIHVFGNGWELFEGKGKENLIIEKGNAYVARKAVADAKISLNIMPWFKAGFQERIATAMLSGTVAVTDESEYINANYQDCGEMVTFSLEKLEELPLKIKYLLENVEDAQIVAERGRKCALNNMTWQDRTLEMVDFIRGIYIHKENNGYGKLLRIPYREEMLCNRSFAMDIIQGVEKIRDSVYHIQEHAKIDVFDIKYLYTQLLYVYLKASANFPQLNIKDFVYDYEMNLTEETLDNGIDVLLLQCESLLLPFYKAENEYLARALEVEKNRKTATVNTGLDMLCGVSREDSKAGSDSY